jgi:hypothetical protein
LYGSGAGVGLETERWMGWIVCNGLGMSDQNFDKREEKSLEGRMRRETACS